MGGVWAIVSREFVRLRRNPMLLMMSMVFPLIQLLVLGYAFGGKVTHARIAVVDQDRRVPAVKMRELIGAIASGAKTVDVIDYADRTKALQALHEGRVQGVAIIPEAYSRSLLADREARIALVVDNSDAIVAAALEAAFSRLVTTLEPNGTRRAPPVRLEIVERYAYVPYIQFLLPGCITVAIFTMSMFGGGIVYVDDKARGLHEGYLVTPLTQVQIVAGFNLAGIMKAVLTGIVITIVGGLLAGVPHLFEPLRLFRLGVVVVATATALISFMFLFMARTDDPILPRALFGVLNTVLFFPSGAVYPQEGFPRWMQAMSTVNPFTYAVDAFRSVLAKNTGLDAVAGDLLFLAGFSVAAALLAALIFKRTL